MPVSGRKWPAPLAAPRYVRSLDGSVKPEMNAPPQAATLPERAGAPVSLSWPWLDSAWAVAGWYLVATVILTWPLLPGILHDVPADLGDPLLNCWILHWDADHFLRFLSGDPGALRGFWSANIFYPAPLALAYSEHLVPQAIAILPVYAVTGNLVLCYNLLFLSTFVLSGLGVYLLARSLTGNAPAAFLAGLLFAFSPYRIAQLSHVQVLSTQWMPLTLYGLHRFYETRRRRALAGASAALLAQNLSCGYFLLYFAPLAAAYAAWEVVRRRLTRDWRLLAQLAAAGVVVALGTWPFLVPYLELRDLGYSARGMEEVRMFSANVLAYLTGPTHIRGWGQLFQVFPWPEGELFPGLVASVLAAGALTMVTRSAWTASSAPALRGWRRRFSALAGVSTVTLVAVVCYLLAGGSRVLELGALELRLKDFSRPVWLALVSGAGWAALTPRVRETGRAVLGRCGFWMLAALAAAFLSFGPVIRTGARDIATGPYLPLYLYVPGFDGLRVPARFGLVVTLMVSVLAALALDRLLRGRRRPGLLFGAVALLLLSESLPTPIPVNASGGTESLVAPAPVRQGARVPAVYRYLRDLPGGEPVLEFPFGFTGYELQYVYYTTEHGHPIVNGYSGVFPPRYIALRQILEDEERRWDALSRSGARLVVVHEGAYRRRAEGERISGWLASRGASLVAAFEGDKVFRLP